MSPGRWILCFAIATAACAIPGRLYEVTPAVSGRLYSGDDPTDAAQLRLRVVQAESANLHAHEVSAVAADGQFAFDAMQLDVAGHEYTKNYRVFLHYREGDASRVIWRVQFSRRDLAGPVELDCDLERPVQYGQPCQVVDPLEHPWLAQQGERTYRRFCVGCHGIDGRGVIGTDAPSGGKPPDLRTLALRHGGAFDRAKVTEWIEGRALPDEHGARTMPVWGERLSSTEYARFWDRDGLIGAALDPLVVYLESIQETE